MAATSVVAGLLAVALQAINGVLLSLWNEWLAVLGVPCAGFLALFMATSDVRMDAHERCRTWFWQVRRPRGASPGSSS